MSKFSKNDSFILLIFLFVAFCWYSMYRKDKSENVEKCILTKMEIKGLIKWESGHGSYNYIEINNFKKSVRVSIDETKYLKGFPEDYTYEIGDSIIKKAGANEFTIKNGKNIAVHIIDCDN